MCIRDSVYPDRVEVNSPGGLWSDRTVDNIDENRSVSRNPSLANLLSNLPTPSGSMRVAENQGSGIQRMRKGMERYGLPQPRFDARIGEFTVTLYRFGILNSEVSKWLAAVAPESTREEQIALAIAQGLGAVSVRELREHIGLDSDDARNLLGGLAERGLLRGRSSDTFVLAVGEPELDEVDRELISYLTEVGEAAARDIANHLGVSVNSLRPRLRKLVDVNEIVPTAPPTSRNRKYRLPD